MNEETLVLDASVGVKWFKDEAGSAAARGLISQLGEGSTRLVVPAVFPFEVLDVARRLFGIAEARALWEGLSAAGVLVASSDEALLADTLEVASSLGCTLYDAAAPALAARLGCPLVSADKRAHARVAGVRLIG
ncbi:MAG: type II toxin-antitoxin system VapC family toxin [Coriobacteriia bacterium]|nr:type II toxin-antitoxin system VapC family toxin [Coriobacteriia bacterium]